MPKSQRIKLLERYKTLTKNPDSISDLISCKELFARTDNLEVIAKEGFNKANSKYKYFLPEDREAFKIYKACLLMVNFSIQNLGWSGTNHFMDASIESENEFLAYKMLVLFAGDNIDDTLGNFDSYVNKYSNSQECQTRDTLEMTIPVCKDYGKIEFPIFEARKLLYKSGKIVLTNFHQIPDITKTMPLAKERAEFERQLLKVKIPNFHENLSLAKMIVKYDMADRFDGMIMGIKSGRIPSDDGVNIAPKSIDHMPDLNIEYTSPTGSKYHLVKSPNILLTLLLGAITGNCQTYANGEEIVDNYIADCLRNPNAGFYLLIKEGRRPFDISHIEDLRKYRHEIVGQSPAYIGKDKSLVFVAFQIIRDRAANINIQELLKDAGVYLEEYGFDRIILGNDRGIDGSIDYDKINSSEDTYYNSVTQTHPSYSWGLKQKEIYLSKKLTAIREELKAMSDQLQNHITSCEQGECVKALLEEGFEPIKGRNYQSFTSNYVTDNWDVAYLREIITKFSELEQSSPVTFERIFGNELIIHEENPYKFGIKIDQIYNLEDIILEFLLSTISKNEFLSIGINVHEFLQRIQDFSDVLDVKKEALKSICRDIFNINSNLDQIDEVSESKIEKCLNASGIYSSTIISPLDIINLEDNVLEFMTNCNLFIGFARIGKLDIRELLSMGKLDLQKIIFKTMFDHLKKANPVEGAFLDIDMFLSLMDEDILDLVSYNFSAIEFFFNLENLKSMQAKSTINKHDIIIGSLKNDFLGDHSHKFIDLLTDKQLSNLMKLEDIKRHEIFLEAAKPEVSFNDLIERFFGKGLEEDAKATASMECTGGGSDFAAAAASDDLV